MTPTILNLNDIKEIHKGMPSLSDFKYSLYWYGPNIIQVSNLEDYDKIAEYCNIIQFDRRKTRLGGNNVSWEPYQFLKIEFLNV